MTWKLGGLLGAVLLCAVVVARLLQDSGTGTASWDASRAAGFASYLLLWASTVTGVAVHMRFRATGGPLTLMLEFHRVTSVLALAFAAAHVLGLLVDPVVRFSVVDAVVPFTSGYRPLQVGAGTIAQWLLVAVLVTTAAAARVLYAAWRRVHFLSFPCYVLALIHGITSGTSTGNSAALALYTSTAATVAALLVVRVAGRGWVTAGES
ncbi:MAG: ferric reductase-like transmembrane domain-containing protein [Chloroflexi bacterium]|nr:ferric reductase-like transmembrane domain-containing protein [Chloroflexota bacterium]